jgi:hypothetical protein
MAGGARENADSAEPAATLAEQRHAVKDYFPNHIRPTIGCTPRGLHKRIALYFFDKNVYCAQYFLVCLAPMEVVFFSPRGPDDLHRADVGFGSINSSSDSSPLSASSID